MQVHVMLFANLKQRAGRGELSLELAEPATVRSAATALTDRLDGIDLKGVMCAVNERFADPATPLSEGDTVAFLPPVSGG